MALMTVDSDPGCASARGRHWLAFYREASWAMTV